MKMANVRSSENGRGRDRVSAGASALAVIALIVALAALAIAVVAYNRSGQDLDDQIAEQMAEALTTARLEFARADAAATLTAVQIEQRAEQDFEALEEDVAQVRADLADAYRRAERETSQEWRELDAELEELEAQARDQSADILAGLESAISALRQEVRVDD